MSIIFRNVPFEPFFLAAPSGRRFCIYYPHIGPARGGIVYVHPFAEEMNKSRRMAALQARALAVAGYSVLLVDLFGCGDSDGDFLDADWETWRQDVALGAGWLSQRTSGAITLWGLRLGALLALDAAAFCSARPERFILWQPPVSGDALLTQFLRLRLASEMLSSGSATTGVKELRAEMASGASIEIAGYGLNPRLAAAIGNLNLACVQPLNAAVHWLEVAAEPGPELSPASRRVVEVWTQHGVRLRTQRVAGQPFWNTVETTECPALIAATTSLLAAETQ